MSKNILIVDDKPEIAKVITIQLSKDYNVHSEGNPIEALAWMHAGNIPDLIISDVNMPEMDGYETVRAIRRSAKPDAAGVPVFAMTANAFAEDVTAAMDAGMNGHIAKPIETNILYETLQEVFKNHEQI